ncbi:MAG: reverse transcriptase domain-containing protein, partial [Candidatus Thiodiazotropha sp.]
MLPADMFQRLTEKASYVKETQGKSIKERHVRKFNTLLNKHYRIVDSMQPDRTAHVEQRTVINISSKTLSDTENTLLEKGLNFTVSKSILKAEEVIPGIEQAIKDLSTPDAENIRAQIIGILKSQAIGSPNLTKEERAALIKIKNDDQLIVTKADKGNTTIVMDRSEYHDKVKKHLMEGPYKKVNGINIDTIMSKEKEAVGNYLRVIKEKLGKAKWYALYPKAITMPRLYGQPKVHKPGIPIRPIVDGIDSPTHELARHLAQVLKPLTGKTQSYIKNGHSFVEKIKQVTIEPEDTMISFDIVSLYTNVPKNRAIERLTELLIEDETLNMRTKLTVEQIVEGIALCLNASYFRYDTAIYSQEQGLAMGSPISPVLANIYMEHVESQILNQFPHPPKIWWRYVDDTFVIMKRDQIDTFLEFLNTVDANIKFTMDVETENGTLPFLDCLVHKCTDKLKTTIYRKPTNPLRVLKYSSANPKSTFMSIAYSMFKKIEDFCTDEVDKKKQRNEVQQLLINNGYPKALVKKQIKKALNPLPTVKKEWSKTVVLPYKQGTSEAIQRVLNTANIRLASKRGSTLRSSLVKLKDPLPREKTRNCI